MSRDKDKALLKKLGLKCLSYEEFQGSEMHYIGTLKFDEMRVEVWVARCTAQFWEFRTSKGITFGTGSGSFREYWSILEPLFKNMANEMIVVERSKTYMRKEGK
jgi:hypothetical protein